jgi:hypothetical protein
MTTNIIQKVVKTEPPRPKEESNIVHLGETDSPKSPVQEPPKPNQESNIVTKSAEPKDGK